MREEAMNARHASRYVGLALLGGVFGAAVGLLMAPAPGNETRRRVVRRPSVEDQELRLRQAEMAAELPDDELDLPASA